jgi:TatD DNase family protein
MRVGRWIPAAIASGSRNSVLSFATTKNSSRHHTAGRHMTSVPLVDVDCNLWHKDLSSLQNKDESSPLAILNEDAVQESNIVALLSPSSTIGEAEMGLDVLKSCEPTSIPILTTAGVHPYHVNDDENASIEGDMQKLRELIRQRYVCAVGECGLDQCEGFPPLEDQLPWFRAQVELAQEVQKPLFVHERLAFEQTLKVLQDCTVPVIIHCFTGTPLECREYAKRGYYFSVSGYIFKQNAKETRACLVEGLIPLDKLMIETDAPYMGFDGCRSRYLEKHSEFLASLNRKIRKRLQNSIYPNVPSSLPMVLDEVVRCLNEGRAERDERLLGREDIARATTENAVRLFGFEGVNL